MASISDDELEYLSPSFSPSSLTVPRLRSILLAHDIHHPASAKKPQLIELFNQELLPRSKKILAARSRIRRTSKGITDMPSSQSGIADGDDGGLAGSMPPPPIPDTPKRKPRKNSRQPSEDSNADHPNNRRAGKNPSKHPRQSDTETSEMDTRRPTARKTRRSDVATIVKTEEPNDKSTRPRLEKSPFSDENPFQSGSSPSAPTQSRRKSAGSNVNRSKSVSRRRKTEGFTSATRSREIQQDGIVVPSSNTFSMPVANYGSSQHHERLEIEAGEDFTPEEQLDLVREQNVNGKVDVLPPRRRKGSNRRNSVPRSAPWVIVLALLSGYALWFRREKIEIGYCGTGRASYTISNYQMPDWTSFLQPECEPCPQHAFCYEDMEARCEPDFILRPHPLSIGGLIPLPPACEPDGEKAQRVKAVADRAIELLRERKAGSECGTLVDEQQNVVRSPEIDEQELKRKVASKRRKGMSEREFEELWKGALGEMAGREEVIQSHDRYDCSRISCCIVLHDFILDVTISHIEI